MLVYDLICSRGHRFEGWFQGLDDLESQLASRMLTCPVCNDESISRLPSTFGLVKSGRSEAEEPKAEQQPAAPMAQLQDIIRRWSEISSRLEKEFDDVGSDFADEALKMHYGVTSRRNIRGLSTETQEETLRREGVEFFKVPMFRKNPHSTEN